MHKPLQPLAPAPQVNELVQAAIKQFILDNRLQSGDKLPSENSLSKQLGVSRNSVREAVQSLASLGVIEVRRGSGLFVRGFTLQPLIENLSYGVLYNLRELEDLLQVREVLESGMVDVALTLLTDEDIKSISAIVDQMYVRAGRGEPLVEQDQAFHMALFRPVGNSILLELQDIFWQTFRKARSHFDISDSNPTRTADLHAAIVSALKTGDAIRVRGALSSHYDDIKARLSQLKEARHTATLDGETES